MEEEVETRPWAKELSQLAEIGFLDEALNIVLLDDYKGKVPHVVAELVKMTSESSAIDDEWEQVTRANDGNPEELL